MLNLPQSQEYALGQYLRETYLESSSPSFIQGIETDVANVDQLFVRADAGGGNVILDSAYALLQGLYPPTASSKSVLGDGQTVEAPLGGYQYIPVESLEFWQAPSLTSWMECPVCLCGGPCQNTDSVFLVFRPSPRSYKQWCCIARIGCASCAFPSSCYTLPQRDE